MSMGKDHGHQSRSLRWANCQQPWRGELNDLGVRWISGELTNEQLALRLVLLRSELEFNRQPDEGSKLIPFTKEFNDLTILSEALVVTHGPVETTPAQRRRALDNMRSTYEHDPGMGR